MSFFVGSLIFSLWILVHVYIHMYTKGHEKYLKHGDFIHLADSIPYVIKTTSRKDLFIFSTPPYPQHLSM